MPSGTNHLRQLRSALAQKIAQAEILIARGDTHLQSSTSEMILELDRLFACKWSQSMGGIILPRPATEQSHLKARKAIDGWKKALPKIWS